MNTGSHNIVLLGYGEENRQFHDWLVGIKKIDPKRIIIADKKTDPKYLEKLFQPNISKIYKSPGIWSLIPDLEKFRAIHGQRSVLSPLAPFFEIFRNQIIGVTGTKGKTTTASIITHLLKKSGVKVHYCGNTVGISPYQFWTKRDQKVDPDEYFVVELSSFQLQDLAYSQISPKYAVITNYYVDHQDHHASVEEYWAAKDTIFKWQQEGDFCIKDISPELNVKINQIVKHALIGDHNKENVSKAVLVVEQVTGNKLVDFEGCMDDFQSVDHRLQLVRTMHRKDLEIRFYDDGAATEPEAVIAAVEALTLNNNEKLWLHITGNHKGGDLEKLRNTITVKTQENALFEVDYCGEVGQILSNTPDRLNFKRTVSKQFKNLGTKIEELSGVLNIVLSPCGSSFDEFEDYKKRSQWWIDQVNGINLD